MSDGDVTVVDLRARKALHEIKVGGKPEGVTWIGSGPLAAVTVYREDLVVFLDTGTGVVAGGAPIEARSRAQGILEISTLALARRAASLSL